MRVTIRKVAEEIDITCTSAQDIMRDKLGMHCVCARWVPRPLLPTKMRE